MPKNSQDTSVDVKHKAAEPPKNGSSAVQYPIVGKSKATEQVLKQIARLAKHRRDVVIIGEEGVGKGAIAKNIFYENLSVVPNQRLISINMAVADDRELDTFLAGSENTEAGISKQGILSTGSPWTILVEEIEEASFRNQIKVLQLLNERFSRRTGGKEGADVRIIFTMKSEPSMLVEKRKLLDELYTRTLDFEKVEVAPLRQRPEDVPLLVRQFADELCEVLGVDDLVIDPNALEVLVRQPWRENIRELKAVVDKSVLLSNDGRFILPPELVDEKTEVVRMINNIKSGQEFVLDESLDVIEKGIIERSLERFGFNQSRAAQFLGMTEQTFRYKLKRLGIASARMRS